jgi:hypothetical protein
MHAQPAHEFDALLIRHTAKANPRLRADRQTCRPVAEPRCRWDGDVYLGRETSLKQGSDLYTLSLQTTTMQACGC